MARTSTKRDAELDAIAHREHGNPHTVLGAHPKRSGVVIRALRPGATAVTALIDGSDSAEDSRVELKCVHPVGIFQGTLKGASMPLSYRIEAAYGDQLTHTQVDLYLIGEGRHERIYDVLGAHPRIHQDVAGTAFAVWAPAARSVSVVGDINF